MLHGRTGKIKTSAERMGENLFTGIIGLVWNLFVIVMPPLQWSEIRNGTLNGWERAKGATRRLCGR